MEIEKLKAEDLLKLPALSNDIPKDPLQRIRLFVQELAWGAASGLCFAVSYIRDNFSEHEANFVFQSYSEGIVNEQLMQHFFDLKWGANAPYPDNLVSQGYLDGGRTSLASGGYELTQQGWTLLNEIQTTKVFISYCNAESSAFALLLAARMKAQGINPYLDIADLQGGEQWEKAIENNIIAGSAVVVLIGPTTLASPYVRKEIEIAQRENKRVIPVLHNGCTDEVLKTGQYFADMFRDTQCIQVRDEKAYAYDSSVVRVLNCFGINP